MTKKLERLLMYIFISALLFTTILTVSTRKYVFKDRSYDSKEKVALYIMEFQELPPNFLSKAVAKETYHNYALAILKGYNIGGDRFSGKQNPSYVDWIGNYEDELDDLYECDIYLDREEIIENKNRGTSRLVYSGDGSFVYYTDNHYGENELPGFVLLTSFKINLVSNIFLIATIILIVLMIGYTLFMLVSKKMRKKFLCNLKDVSIKIFLGIVSILLLPIYGILFIIKLISSKILYLINEYSK